MFLWPLLMLLPGQAVESKDFPKDLQMKAVAATVRIVNRTKRTEGTGVIVGRNGEGLYVLTAAHLLAPDDRFEVSTYSKESYPQSVKTYKKGDLALQTRDIRDLALIRLATEDRPPAVMPICPMPKLPSGEKFDALSVGCGTGTAPLSLLETVLKEKRVRRPPGRETARFWETDMAQMPGRSGGPLLNKRGELIGLASGASEGRGFYSHGAEIHAWLKEGRFAFLLEEKEEKDKKDKR